MGRAIAGALLLFLLLGPAQAEPNFPALTGRVVDETGTLTPATIERLTALLAEEEQKTGDQLVVAVVKSLQGDSIEDYGYRLGRFWGIGQKGKDNGVILLVAPNEHQVRIEVGYGLEGTLTDAQSRIIIERAILPAFRRGDVNAGVMAGTAAILDVLGGVAPVDAGSAGAASDAAPGGVSIGGFGILIPIFIFILFFGMRGLFWPLFVGSALGGMGRRGGMVYGGGMGGFGGGGFGGGFSGGGGSFGGGGASGGW